MVQHKAWNHTKTPVPYSRGVLRKLTNGHNIKVRSQVLAHGWVEHIQFGWSVVFYHYFTYQILL